MRDRLYSTTEALAEVRKDPTIAADPYRLAEVFAALVSGCNEAAYNAGYEAGRRYERGDDEVTDELFDEDNDLRDETLVETRGTR